MFDEKLLTFGKLDVRIYDMDKGEGLKEHSHGVTDSHITICAKGSVSVITPEWTKTLKAGNIIEFFPLQPHSIIALEDNSRVVNIVK